MFENSKERKKKKTLFCFEQGLSDKSALLKHEIAYVMGQTRDPYCIPILTRVLTNQKENTMVRHEVCFLQKREKREKKESEREKRVYVCVYVYCCF